MSRDDVKRLVHRCERDSDFRDGVRTGGRAYVEAAGFTLDELEWAALGDVDWSLSVPELLNRYGDNARAT